MVALQSLLERLDNDSDFVAAAVAAETFHESLLAALRTVGVHAYAAVSDDPAARQAGLVNSDWVGVVLDADTIGVTTAGELTERAWQANSARNGYEQHRLFRLLDAVRGLIGRTEDISALLNLRYDAASPMVPLMRIALAAWHDIRIAEGHTPDSARFLLSLVADPTLLAVVSFDPITGTPSLPSTFPRPSSAPTVQLGGWALA